MVETVVHKKRLSQAGSSQPYIQENTNWLFTCQVCGEPITFDEPLVTWAQDSTVHVAHCRCAPNRCMQTGR